MSFTFGQLVELGLGFVIGILLGAILLPWTILAINILLNVVRVNPDFRNLAISLRPHPTGVLGRFASLFNGFGLLLAAGAIPMLAFLEAMNGNLGSLAFLPGYLIGALLGFGVFVFYRDRNSDSEGR